MRASDFELGDTKELDHILADLCAMVIRGQQTNPEKYGMVAAAVLDPQGRLVSALNYRRDNKDVHGERAAMDRYQAQYGDIPTGSTVITTCSPCTDPMPDRMGESCKDLISASNVHKVYAGYRDPSQTHDDHKTYHLEITRNPQIQELCQRFADTWLRDELTELSFLGSECTKDCSGHRAGYAWYKRKGYEPASWSPSFNKGAALAAAGR